MNEKKKKKGELHQGSYKILKLPQYSYNIQYYINILLKLLNIHLYPNKQFSFVRNCWYINYLVIYQNKLQYSRWSINYLYSYNKIVYLYI